MIKKIVKLAITGFVYFAVATLITQGIILVYTWFAWDMTWQRGQDAIAVARGEASIETPVKLETLVEQVAEEQPSFEEILQARALKTRDFELRDEALEQGKAILRQQQETFFKESETLAQSRTQFERQVAEYESRSQAAGLEQNVTLLQGMDPQLAKVQLLTMYNEKEMESLIDIVKAMETRKCVEILDIFTTKEDEEKVAEILRRIRDGFEFKPPIDTTTSNLPPQI